MKQMAEKLSDSLKILVPAADKTRLAESLEKAEAVTGSYTQETWQPFLKARETARELMKNNNLKAEEQNVVETARTELDRTMKALVAAGDKTDLSHMIAEAEQINTSQSTTADVYTRQDLHALWCTEEGAGHSGSGSRKSWESHGFGME